MKNLRTTEKKAKSTDEAIALALAELNIEKDDAIIEIIDEGSKGFLGIGSKEAVVRVTEKINIEKLATSFLDSMTTKIVSNVEYDVTYNEKGLKIVMSGDDMGILIGRRGDTLDALQYLTSLYVNRYSDEYIKVYLDTENYREKRHDTLVRLARRLATQVINTKKSVTIEPMNPNERRIIHSTLQNNKLVTTSSIGEEPNRRVVISLISKTKSEVE